MKKYNKKIALILALSLTLALAIPALAAQTNISGSYTATGEQVINVVVSGGTTVKAFLNPKGYEAGIYSNADDAALKNNPNAAVTSIAQLKPSGDITTMPIVGVNLGKSAVAVKAAVTSTLTGKFKFGSSAPSTTSTNGLVFLEAKVVEGYDLDYDTSANKAQWDNTGRYDSFDGAEVVKALNEWTDDPDLAWIKSDLTDRAEKADFTAKFNTKKKTNQYINSQQKALGYKDEIIVLKKGTAESRQQLCTVPAAGATDPSYFIARLSGRIGQGDPTRAGKGWSENDGFGSSIIWTFQTTTVQQ